METETPPPAAYPETADIETSSDEYATRFAGAAGQYMLDVQRDLTLALVRAQSDTATVLDVGGGHGQLAIPLAEAGYTLTVLGSDLSCRHRIASICEDGRCTFDVGNVVELPYEDNAFDTVISFRLVTHCEQWPQLIRELCRVARHAVIVDYPTHQSVNAIAPALFGAKKKIEVNTRTWQLFYHREIRDACAGEHWKLHRQKKQFFFPMVLHRMMKSRALSTGLEGIARAVGLTALLGSPVIAAFRPE